MYYNIPRVKAPLLVIKISKKTSSQSWRLYFALKQNETKHKLISTPRKHPRNARVISAKDLGTMSKSNLRRITLARGPIWGIHSLTLIISWCTLSPIMKNVNSFRTLQVSTSSPGPSPRRFSKWRIVGRRPGVTWSRGHVVQNLQKSWRFLSRDILRKAKTKWRRSIAWEAKCRSKNVLTL